MRRSVRALMAEAVCEQISVQEEKDDCGYLRGVRPGRRFTVSRPADSGADVVDAPNRSTGLQCLRDEKPARTASAAANVVEPPPVLPKRADA